MANYFDRYNDHPPSGATQAADDSDAQTGFVPPTGPVRGTGLGVRNVVEGVLGGPYDLIARGINATGLLPPINSLSDNLSNWGLPTPQTPEERNIAAVVEPVAGSLGASGAARLATKVANPIVSAVSKAVADQPVTQAVSAGAGAATTEATGDPRLGLAVSMVSPFAITAANRGARAVENTVLGVTKPNAELGDLARTKYNIPIGGPDMSDNSMTRLVIDQGGKVPFSGARSAAEAKHAAWQKAISTEMGDPAATNFRPDVLGPNAARLSQGFEDVANRTSIGPAETALIEQNLDTVLHDAKRLYTSKEIEPLEIQINDLKKFIADNNGTISGAAYQKLTNSKSLLSKLERQDSNISESAGDVIDHLDDALQRSAQPGDQEALTKLRYQYRVMRTVDQLAAKSKTGDITPEGFKEKVVAASRKYDAPTGGIAYTGGGNIGELMRIGLMMRSPPNSGTADRAMINAMVGGYGGTTAAGGLARLMDPSFFGVPAAAFTANRAAGSYLRSGSLANRLIENAMGTAPTLQNQLMRAFQTSGVTGLEAELQQGKMPPKHN